MKAVISIVVFAPIVMWFLPRVLQEHRMRKGMKELRKELRLLLKENEGESGGFLS